MLLKYLRTNKTLVLFYVASIFLMLFIGFFRLSTLMPGLAKPEFETSKLLLGWHGILNDPLNLIINVIRSVIFKTVNIKSAFDLRLPSVILGLSSMIGFYFLLKSYYGHKTAIIGSFLFDCSALLIHLTRFGSNMVEYLFSMVFILLINSFVAKRSLNPYLFSIFIFILLLISFNPGTIWLIILGFILIFRQYKAIFLKFRSILSFISLFLSIALPLSLLLWYSVKNPINIFGYLAIPIRSFNINHFLSSIAITLRDIFIFNTAQPDLWLGHSPTLDALGLVSLVLGGYYLIKHFKSSRVQYLASSLVLAILLIALNRNLMNIGLVLPILFIIITVGISYLLQSWYKVFPSNPIARFIGLSLIIVVIALSCLFNLRSYFVAWAYNPTSRAAFQIKD